MPPPMGPGPNQMSGYGSKMHPNMMSGGGPQMAPYQQHNSQYPTQGKPRE